MPAYRLASISQAVWPHPNRVSFCLCDNINYGKVIIIKKTEQIRLDSQYSFAYYMIYKDTLCLR